MGPTSIFGVGFDHLPVPTSKLTLVTSLASVLNCATMELTVNFSSNISPWTSTFTILDR